MSPSLLGIVRKTLLLAALAAFSRPSLAEEPAQVVDLAQAIGLEFGPRTTVIEGPVGPDGLPDYVEATNRKLAAGVTPAENFWALAWVAIGNAEGSSPEYLAAVSRRLQVEIPATSLLKSSVIGHGPNERAEIMAFAEATQAALERPWKRSDHPKIVQWLEEKQALMARLAEAARRSKAYAPLVSDTQPDDSYSAIPSILLPHVQSSRRMAELFRLQAMLRLDERDFEGAWSDLLTVLRIARHVESGPCLIERYVGMDLRSGAHDGLAHWLARVDLSAEALEKRRQELAPLLEVPSLAESLDWERFSYLDIAISMVARKNSPRLLRDELLKPKRGRGSPWDRALGSDLRKGSEAALTRLAIASIDINATLRYGNDFYDRLVAAIRPATHAERKAKLDVLRKQLGADRAESQDAAALLTDLVLAPGSAPSLLPAKGLVAILCEALLPSEERYTSAIARTATLDAAFRLVIEARRIGTVPASLEGIVDQGTGQNAIPSDPFTGGPLRMRSDERGDRDLERRPEREGRRGASPG